METTLKTKQGSVIARYHNNVGKRVGKQIYVHKLYADEIIPKSILQKSISMLTRAYPEFDYNCLMFDASNNLIRFDEAPDFDTAREPHVGDYIVIDPIGKSQSRQGHSDNIWHHKWMWVKDDYTGFDVDKSKEWSRIWLSKLDEPAKGTDLHWNSQLFRHGLEKQSLTEGVRLDKLSTDIAKLEGFVSHFQSEIHNLENEWDNLNDKNLDFVRQSEIANRMHTLSIKIENLQFKIKKLEAEKEKWNGMYAATQLSEGKQLVMEAKLEETAIDYLKELVKASPYKGQVFLAGGPVRDLVMGNIPKDLDIAVTGHGLTGGLEFAIWATKHMRNYKGGDSTILINFVKTNWQLIQDKNEEIMEQLTRLLKNFSNPVLFPTFGTAKFELRDVIHKGVDLSNVDVETVATRKEQYIHGSRKPIVSPGTIEDDVFRRDYTINSLLLDLTTDEILDITGRGKSDIKNGLVRTTSSPEEIYHQDSLRILRGLRFATKYGFKIDPETFEGMKNNIDELQYISKERIRDELDKMLVLKHPENALHLLKDIGALKYVIPELEQAIGMGQNKYHKHDVFLHSLEVLKQTKPILLNRLTALLHDIGKVRTKTVVDNEIHFYAHESVGSDMVREILSRLKYPSDIIDAVVLGVRHHMRLKRSGEQGELVSDKALRKFAADLGDHLETILDVMQADNLAHEGDHTQPLQIPGISKRIDQLKNSIPKKGEPLPVTGEDLKILGLKPGPLFSELLALVKDKQMENPMTTKGQYLDMIKDYLNNKPK